MAARLQGTDGVRRIVRASDDPTLAGLTPQEAFLRHDVITEQFVELYTYCRIVQLTDAGVIRPGDPVVVGWDTRDPAGRYTGGALAGLRKAGVDVHALGVAPTPLVPLYQRYVGAAAGFMVTASHNPSSYNGVKIFTRTGLKLLPGDDVALSARVLDTRWDDVAPLPFTGALRDARNEAIPLFKRLHLDAANSRIGDRATLARHTLVVDTAHGALCGIAADVLRDAGFGTVIPVNDDPARPINIRSGVADIEGLTLIPPDAAAPGGRFAGYAALETLLREGRACREQGMNGGRVVAAAVFDGDGDRFYRVEYDPFDDVLRVLSGDESSLLQAKALLGEGGGERPDALFVNTVESDLAAQQAAARLGYDTALTAVGDKWVLLTALLCQLEELLPAVVMGAVDEEARSSWPSADRIEALLDEAGFDPTTAPAGRFTVGAEETGHAITPLYTDRGVLFAGNGLKSCLNTFAATAAITGPSPEETFRAVTRPFAPGFKKTLYAYYVAKERWRRGSDVWERLQATMNREIARHLPEAAVEEMIRPEDGDMLYLKLLVDGIHAGSLFIRNSGTEDKTGLNLRGIVSLRERLEMLGETVIRELMACMKDETKPMAVAERELLRRAAEGGAPDALDGLDHERYHHLLMEVGAKQGLLTAPSPGATLTDRGAWTVNRFPPNARETR